MRREALNTVGVLMAGTAVLVVVFWVVREWPQFADPCVVDRTAGERAEIEAFQRGYVPIHAAIGLGLAWAVWRLQAARRGRRRPGLPTTAALGVSAGAYLASFATREALAIGWFTVFPAFVLAPFTGVLVVAALLLLGYERTDRAGAAVALVAAWLALLAVLPAHFVAVGWADEPWCLD